MDMDQLNLNALKVFISVYKNKSMTEAAKELHLTQSGVSQHIKNLEDETELKLFDRLHRQLIPTEDADLFYKKCSDSLHQIENCLRELRGEETRLKGPVRLGVPIEFGNNLILPEISKFREQHPDIHFSIQYGFAYQMTEELLRGQMDFAFIDSVKVDPRIETKSVFDEELELCLNSETAKKLSRIRNEKAFYESLDYVAYQPDGPVLNMWFQQHLGRKKMNLKIAAHLMDVRGVAMMIHNGVGAGVLPHYLIEALRKENIKFYKFKGSGKTLKNRISLASLKEKTHSAAVLELMDYLKEKLTR